MSDKKHVERADVEPLLCVFCEDFSENMCVLGCGHLCCKNCSQQRQSLSLGVLLLDNPPDDLIKLYPKPVYCKVCNACTHGNDIKDVDIREKIDAFKAKYGVKELSIEDFDYEKRCVSEEDHKKLEEFAKAAEEFQVVDFDAMEIKQLNALEANQKSLLKRLAEGENVQKEKINQERVQMEERYNEHRKEVTAYRQRLTKVLEVARKAKESGNEAKIKAASEELERVSKEVEAFIKEAKERDFHPRPLPPVVSEKEIHFEVRGPEFGRMIENPTLIKKYLLDFYTAQANAGNSWAQYMLGECYYHGQGVEKNTGKARELFQEAKQGGEKKAEKALSHKF